MNCTIIFSESSQKNIYLPLISGWKMFVTKKKKLALALCINNRIVVTSIKQIFYLFVFIKV